MAQDRADSDGFPANAAVVAAAVVGGPARGRACRGERVGAVVVGVVVVEWCAGGLAWFPWIWGGFGPVLGRNPASATGRGRWGEGEGESGRLPASGARVGGSVGEGDAAGGAAGEGA